VDVVSHYSDGRRIEYIVIDDLTDNGYQCTRAASSKGVADVIAIKPGQVCLVNVKRTTMPGPDERRRLLDVCNGDGYLLPLVALKPLRKRLEYRLLTGPGPKDWLTWTPDEVMTRPAPATPTSTPSPSSAPSRATACGSPATNARKPCASCATRA